jgi:23S rRNA pseudouridine1911/1915/1917 synthase
MKPSMEWVVAKGDGHAVSDVVAKMRALGAPVRARVFVNGRPAEDTDPVEQGDRVELYPRRDSFRGKTQVEILAQRDGVVLVFKPAGVPTETTRLGEDSVVSELIDMLKHSKVHAATRLDVAVSGIVVCTLGTDATRRVNHWREAEQLKRTYIAIASGAAVGEGRWTDALGRMRDRGGRHKSSPHVAGAKQATTRYTVIAALVRAHDETATLLSLEPETGRMHQLRAHASLNGCPLFGDRLYNGPSSVTDEEGRVARVEGIALHCAHVSLPNASATAPVPAQMVDLWTTLGGDEGDFNPPP